MNTSYVQVKGWRFLLPATFLSIFKCHMNFDPFQWHNWLFIYIIFNFKYLPTSNTAGLLLDLNVCKYKKQQNMLGNVSIPACCAMRSLLVTRMNDNNPVWWGEDEDCPTMAHAAGIFIPNYYWFIYLKKD